MTNTTNLRTAAERDAEIIRLQSVLLDHSGHVVTTLRPIERRALVARINDLRRANGWAPLDMRGR